MTIYCSELVNIYPITIELPDEYAAKALIDICDHWVKINCEKDTDWRSINEESIELADKLRMQLSKHIWQ